MGQLREIMERPDTIFRILRTAVPEVSGFFFNYLMAMLAVTTPMLLWQPLWASPPKPHFPPALKRISVESLSGKDEEHKDTEPQREPSPENDNSDVDKDVCAKTESCER